MNRVQKYFDSPELHAMNAEPRTAKKETAKERKRQPHEAFVQAINEAGLKQKEVAAFMGVHESRVSSLMKGKSFPSARADAMILAIAVGCDVDSMLRGEYRKDPKWFRIRTMPIDDKIKALLASDETRRMMTATIDALFAQYIA